MSESRLLDLLIIALLPCLLWSTSGVLGAGSSGLAEYVRYAVFGGLSILIVVVALADGRSRFQLSAAPTLLLAFLSYTAVSAAWSEGGTSAFIKTGLIALATAATLFAGTSRSSDWLMTRVVIVCGIVVVLGAIVAVVAPSIGVETGWLLEGKWRGLSGQKNGFGALSGLALVGTAVLMLGRPTARGSRAVWLPLVLIAGFAFCLYMSGSRGAQMLTVVGLASALFVRLSERTQILAITLCAILAVPIFLVAAMTFSGDETHLRVLGLAFDTSSRTEIWAYGLGQWQGHELFGFGLSGFWTPERIATFLHANTWVLDNFHNGYVTILVEGGLTGVALLVATMLLAFRELRRRAATGGRGDVLTFSIFCTQIVHNLVENNLGRSTDFFFVLFLLVIFSLARRDLPQPRPSPAPATLTSR